MEILTQIADVREFVNGAGRAGRRIGLVPTMGFLHAGHLSLIKRARAECDTVIVTIFVNPLQFGPHEDLDRYPRNPEGDLALLQTAGIDLLFAPAATEMYPDGPPLTTVSVPQFSKGLCAQNRPGHFDGVATVVTKLLNICRPDAAYFGRKDYQQLMVIRRLVYDLNLPVEIVDCETVRDTDGLAMSSRNAYLTPPQRRAALVLGRALKAAGELAAAGERQAAALAARAEAVLAAEPSVQVEYLEVVDADTLRPVTRSQGRTLVAVAARVGNTRLIDNTIIEIG